MRGLTLVFMERKKRCLTYYKNTVIILFHYLYHMNKQVHMCIFCIMGTYSDFYLFVILVHDDVFVK